MTTPVGPVIVFDDEFHMHVFKDAALAEEWWEMPAEYSCGFDALGRPLRMVGEPHRVSLELTGEGPAEAELSRLVAGHYRRYLRGQLPPQAFTLAEFVAALPAEGSRLSRPTLRPLRLLSRRWRRRFRRC